MKILVCGMPRSMTTWAFNAVRELLVVPSLKMLWIDPNDMAAEAEFVAADVPVLGKCHHYSHALAEAADFVVYSYRDIRTAAVSAFRKFDSSCSLGQLDAWVQAGDAWIQAGDVILRYEAAEAQPVQALRQLRQSLVARYGKDKISDEESTVILARLDEQFARRQLAEVIDYDSQTMILPGHRTFQPPYEQLSESEAALYKSIEHKFGNWLARRGYLPSATHGQDLDYQLATQILQVLNAPRVIDVGAERGSFMQLALDAGASQVVGFEVLPRHVQFLQQLFAGNHRVDVRPLAVSSQAGRAPFHIALDHEGRELDYHHTLSDLGDSATVNRSSRTIEVDTVTLGDLAESGQLPLDIDFLKIDTDGHDLAVLQGLGVLRPCFILAEYWDTLPETSGSTPYKLNEVADWARAHGYVRSLVIRRHGRIESLEWDACWTQPGDWGNVLFIRDEEEMGRLHAIVQELSYQCGARNIEYVETLTKECEAKEAQIRQLDNEVKRLRQAGIAGVASPVEIEEEVAAVIPQDSKDSHDDMAGNEALPDGDAPEGDGLDHEGRLEKKLKELDAVKKHCELLDELIAQEKKINEMKLALRAYRAALSLRSTVARSMNLMLAPVRYTVAISKHAFKPRLGNLNQYPPRALALPAPYTATMSSEDLPSISIVTPSYNQAAFIERTLDSVLSQDYPSLEYIVRDGGSKDGTVEILESYADRLDRWVSEQDGGQSHAINLGFAKTTGDIMAWLNSDDLLLPGALHRVGEYFVQHPEVDVVYGHRILIDEQDREIGRWVLPAHEDEVLSWADFIPQETLFWRRSIWEKAGGQIDESFQFAMDWDLLLRFRKAGACMVRLPHFLGGFRIHDAQKTSAVISQVGKKEMHRLRLRELGRNVGYLDIRKALWPYMVRHVAEHMGHRLRERSGIGNAY